MQKKIQNFRINYIKEKIINILSSCFLKEPVLIYHQTTLIFNQI